MGTPLSQSQSEGETFLSNGHYHLPLGFAVLKTLEITVKEDGVLLCSGEDNEAISDATHAHLSFFWVIGHIFG